MTQFRHSIINEEEIRNIGFQDGITHFATGIGVINEDHRLLVVRRAAEDYLGGFYELPGGGVDSGETFEESVTRELFEETGLKMLTIVSMFESFDYSTNTKPSVRQLNFIVKCELGSIKLEPKEHDDYKWITTEDISHLKTSGKMAQCLKDAFNSVKTNESRQY